ncbi:MAG: 2-C-methyl-D-erythritol 2,4-cyclodiphosphate synthase [Flavobacteriales bacterium]|nr:2-C-methyl-D-erythritol 2,4-cyclodiphosphate synthase [Flavobacteriales bacterium]
MKIRIGYGFDVHQLRDNHPFWLGGIKLEHHKGAYGHSDADVLIHAICDAILGALNKGDIGQQFPDTSDEFKGIDSKILLKRVVDLMRSDGFEIENIDSTVCLQSPKIGGIIGEMKKVLSDVMGISIDDLSIKATTTEKLGFVGTEEGISAHAVVLCSR